MYHLHPFSVANHSEFPFPGNLALRIQEIVQKMERCGSSSGKTSKKVTIHNCGEEGTEGRTFDEFSWEAMIRID